MAEPPLYMTPVPKEDIERGDGPVLVKFIEAYCHITKESIGGHAGELLQLRQWQKNILGCIFARRPDGRLRHRQALIGLPRKNGKSALGSSIGLYGLIFGQMGSEVYCLDAATRVLCDDLKWRPCGELSTGDGIIGFDENYDHANCRRYRAAHVTSAHRILQPCMEIEFEDGRKVIASSKHRWLGRKYSTCTSVAWIETNDLIPGMRVRDLGKPWTTDASREAGYLAGLYDGEGCIVGAGSRGGTYRHGAIVGFAQKPGAVQDRFEGSMKARGFNLKIRCQGSGVMESKVTGTYECLRLLGSLRPSRLLEKVPHWIDGIGANHGSNWIKVKKVRDLGVREVVAIGTSTKTLFAEGFFSHNSCAVEKDQARIVFNVAKAMVQMHPDLDDRQGGLLHVFRDYIEYGDKTSFYKVLSSEAITKEGLNPTMVIYDELHGAPDDELYNVMTLATGARRDSILVAITTAGTKSDKTGKDSTCYKMYQRGVKICKDFEAGRPVEDSEFFMAWWGAPDGADHRDPKVWAAANPGFNDLIDPGVFEYGLLSTPENEFRTKYLNQWVSAQHAWLPSGAWNACRSERDFTPGARGVVLGFDGSQNGDCTALVAVTVDPEPQVTVEGLWQKPEGAGDEWRVPRGQVMDAIRRACQKYHVREIAADEWRWQGELEELEGEGLPVVAFPQNLGHMGPATQRMYESVIKQKLSHDGNPDLARHFENAQLKTDSRGSRLVKDSKNSPRKIDLAMATVMAIHRAAFFMTEPLEGTIEGIPISQVQFVWGDGDAGDRAAIGQKCARCGNPVTRELHIVGLQVLCRQPCVIKPAVAEETEKEVEADDGYYHGYMVS